MINGRGCLHILGFVHELSHGSRGGSSISKFFPKNFRLGECIGSLGKLGDYTKTLEIGFILVVGRLEVSGSSGCG